MIKQLREPTLSLMGQWAHYYGELGMRPFPLKPRTKDGQVLKSWKAEATSDLQKIDALWRQHSNGNIGVATGIGSGLIDIETDVKAEIDGEQILADWASRNDEIPATWAFRSGGGGIHRLFKAPGELRTRTGLLPCVDVRAEGGYAVFPPSVHPNGKAYEWLPGCSPRDMPDGPADLTFGLFCLLNSKDYGDSPPLEIPEVIPEGIRNVTTFRIACSFREKGLTYDELLFALTGINESRCVPPLEDTELEKICEQAAKYEPGAGMSQIIGASGKPGFFTSRGTFLHNVMGGYLIREYGVCRINGALHVYDNGIYRQGQDSLHGYMLELVPNLTAAKRREVYEYMKVSRMTPSKEIASPNLIPFKSKIYNLGDGSFMDYTPDLVFLNRFPYDYLPDAPEQPLVSDTIARIADHDQEVIHLLYEAIGNCFYLLNAYRGAAMLHGESGNNGKSTLLNMLAQLIGRENASYLSLQDTAERFRLVEMYGKAVNIGDDISAEYLQDSSIFKKLVTGEMVMVEKKGQDAFAFKNFAKMFFAMNRLPPVSDKSKAFFGRLLLIPLTHDFAADGSADVRLKDRIWTRAEMEYLLKLSMDGLHRLMRQGTFTRPAKVAEAVADYERDNNPVLDFLEEYGAIEGKSTKEVYWAFKLWCADAGHKNPMTRRRFTDAVINATGLRSGVAKDPATKKAVRVYALP